MPQDDSSKDDRPMTVDDARKILGKTAETLSDKEIERILETMQYVCLIAYEDMLGDNADPHET